MARSQIATTFSTVWKTSGFEEVGDFGLSGPGDEVFAPEENGEGAGQLGRDFGGGGADEFELMQFGGQVDEEGGEFFAVAGFEGGAEVSGVGPRLGAGDFRGELLTGEQGLDQGAIFRGGGWIGGSGGREGEEDFGERGRREAGFGGGPAGVGLTRKTGAGVQGAENVFVKGAELFPPGGEGRRGHQLKTTVRFL